MQDLFVLVNILRWQSTDYNSGSQHTLPTLGSSKFSSGLNVNDFYKKISYVNLSKKGVAKIGKFAIHLSDFEG